MGHAQAAAQERDHPGMLSSSGSLFFLFGSSGGSSLRILLVFGVAFAGAIFQALTYCFVKKLAMEAQGTVHNMQMTFAYGVSGLVLGPPLMFWASPLAALPPPDFGVLVKNPGVLVKTLGVALLAMIS